MTIRRAKRLKEILDRFYDEYDFAGRIPHDPIEFPRRYRRREDIEVTAFIASCFAYGRVELFRPIIEKILSPMGESPYSFLSDFETKRRGALFAFKYRFNESRDIVALLFIIHSLLREYSTLENAFKRHCRKGDENTGGGIAGFVDEILSLDTSPVYGANIRPPGLIQFFPSPAKGSACKRMNLFLRWMVRRDALDLGVWSRVSPSRLVVPLDTHVIRVGRCLHLTRYTSPGWPMAREITASLRRLDPADPVKYDYALCHLGMMSACGFNRAQRDAHCPLRGVCRPAGRRRRRSPRPSARR